ncbi:alpha/beta hydrolase [Leptolyngbya sp. FACHB-711]|uniref:alpha/beta hydrolase n=1 Tax=Leptolyngbya sp. FACHB-711 TaxID=2692813 RepID=UPI001683BB3F|nr:alpha/beta hydrolase [Leptolyngbya sp. FACHB-711]MBD1851367.1 alpha/beta hydrolase [Cyanobacteria bacterium FACHB-502]MBD2023687.1 alpha/beta hydrolase [Leptolyngbya sp. FACHB-711]
MNCDQDSAVPIDAMSSVGQIVLGKNDQKRHSKSEQQNHKITRFSNLRFSNLGKRVKRFGQIGLLGSVSSFLTTLPALCAQQVNISYGPLEISVPIEALETYAETGEVDRSLRFYTRFIPSENKEQFRQVLRDRIDLDVGEISQVTYSSVGETSLQHLGEVIQTESRQNGFYALRSAAIAAAADAEGLSLLNLIKQFPSHSIRVRADRAMQVADEFSQLAQQTDRITAFIAQQNAADAAAQPLSFDRRTDLQQVGIANWQKQTLTLTDHRRDRAFAVDFYLPNAQTPAPVLIISHGIAADRGDFSELAQHLVSYGFAVAVLDHPGSDTQQLRNWLSGLADEMTAPDEFVHRPQDVSYLIDQVEQLNRSGNFKDRLNLDQIGVIGHSLGGYTALALAGANLNFNLLKQQCQPDLTHLNITNLSMLLQCEALHTTQPTSLQLKDDRVKAVIAMNSASNGIFGQAGLQQIQIPVMMIGGSDDLISPVLLEQVCPFTWLTMPDKYLAVIKKGTHVYSSHSSSRSLFPGETQNPSSGQAQRYLEALSLAFAKVHVAAQPDYRDYLQASYAKSISRSPLDLTLMNGGNARPLAETLGSSCPGAN